MGFALILYALGVLFSIAFLTWKTCVVHRCLTLTDAIEVLFLSLTFLGVCVIVIYILLWAGDSIGRLLRDMSKKTDEIILWKKKWH